MISVNQEDRSLKKVKKSKSEYHFEVKRFHYLFVILAQFEIKFLITVDGDHHFDVAKTINLEGPVHFDLKHISI